MKALTSSGNTVLPMAEIMPSSTSKAGLPVWVYVLNWIFFSNITIIFNKWLIDTAGFKYPIVLTCWHLVFATVATQILARTTTLLNSRHSVSMNRRLYLRTILPISLFYSGSLICSNLVYLYLSVAFIQILKAAAPVAVLFASWVWRVQDPSLSNFINILVIVFGVAIASAGEIEFSWIGFFFQIGGIVFEAMRLLMIQVMLTGENMKMDPLVGLYYYAPACAVMNFAIACAGELAELKLEDVTNIGFSMLFLNALVAFMLNVASVFLIGKTSGLVMTLTGIFKSIILVIASIFIWSTHISLLQVSGYSIALAGLACYSVGLDQLASLYRAFIVSIVNLFNLLFNGYGLPPMAPKGIIIGVFLFLAIVALVELALSSKTMSKPLVLLS